MYREYEPDNWQIVMSIVNNEVTFRIAAGWQGGYAYGRSWKISSTIMRYDVVGDVINFYNSSGSVYCCNAKREGLDWYTSSVVKSYADEYSAQGNSLETIKFDHFVELFLTMDTHRVTIAP